MCTAISVVANGHFFGRTLDYEHSFGEGVAVTGRHFSFKWRHQEEQKEHYAIIGMATMRDEYPLFYDGMNEKGLCVAGLLFAGNAVYFPPCHEYDNVASFEVIPWILSQCKTVSEVKRRVKRLRIINTPFNEELPPTPLHWIVSDKTETIVLESVAEGLKVYENPVGVLTNNPPFDYHMFHLTEFLQINSHPPRNTLYSNVALHPYSRGMGGIGLPGDYSSASRFVRATFVKGHVLFGNDRNENISQFFHVLRSVEVPRGCVSLENNSKAFSLYTSCCDTGRGIYLYQGYDMSETVTIDMHKVNLTSDVTIWYPFGVGNFSH